MTSQQTNASYNCISNLEGDVILEELLENEDIFQYIQRLKGQFDQTMYKNILGAANEFKEGDCIVGVGAANQEQRNRARTLLSNTKIGDLISHPIYTDEQYIQIQNDVDKQSLQQVQDWTFNKLKEFLLTSTNDQIKQVVVGLNSDIIGCIVKLMNNQELIKLGQTVFNPIKGTQIGAKGYMGARIQPNSPTNDPLDIIMQVFNGFSFAVGDVMLGTNPVDSTPESIMQIELALKDIIETFKLQEILPWCVLAHIDIQNKVEKTQPGSTALYFQSIASNENANRTFGISTQKMMDYAASRKGKFGLYLETGQGADFTNGHGHGFDMVLHESRKYGLIRSMMKKIQEVKGPEENVWVVANDVAGFIGPEVFRSKEQLVRVCLEDIAMGKLHGVTIGLDICATLHMNVSLDDLEWCQDQIMPANPGFVMALPTRNDPMLSYITTGFQDHVRFREKFGYKVNDAMWEFFKKIQVIDQDGKPTEHFGDPLWVYYQYMIHKGDSRNREAIILEGRQKLDIVKKHGVFIAEGYGDKLWKLNNNLDQIIRDIFNMSKEAIFYEWDMSFVEKNIPNHVVLNTRISNRIDFLIHPSHGETLNPESIKKIEEIKIQRAINRLNPDAQIVISEGLNAKSIQKNEHIGVYLEELRNSLQKQNFTVAEENFVIVGGRVRVGYRIGEQLFNLQSDQENNRQKKNKRKEDILDEQSSLNKHKAIFHVIGERPGNGNDTFSVYIVAPTIKTWSEQGVVDHNICKVVSGISTTAYDPKAAAKESVRIMQIIMEEHKQEEAQIKKSSNLITTKQEKETSEEIIQNQPLRRSQRNQLKQDVKKEKSRDNEKTMASGRKKMKL